MIVVLVCIWLVGWSLAPLLRCAAAGTAHSAAAAAQRSSGVSLPAGVEDDPIRWPAAAGRSDWTELDERQLIRLLTDSAS